VLVGGPPASGKTTLSGAVADRLGMVVLSSDRVRKELAGLDPRSSAATEFGTGIYSPAASRATYDALLDRAELLLKRGESVVLDATWSAADDRDRAAALADAVSAELVELQCTIDRETARQRLQTRESLSDADETVTERLRNAAQSWPSSHEIDTGGPEQESAEQAFGLVRPYPTPGAILRRRPQLMPD
jgi:uncharacterized protein